MIQLRGLESFWLAVAIVVAATSVTRADDQPYEINAVLPLTGAVAFLGKGEQAALEVVQDLVNKRGGIRGRPIRFVVLDDQSSPQLAVQLTNGLIAKGVPAIIGSTLAAICNAQAPLVKDGPVLFCLSPVITPPAGSYVFTSGQTTDDLISATLRFLQSRGWRAATRHLFALEGYVAPTRTTPGLQRISMPASTASWACPRIAVRAWWRTNTSISPTSVSPPRWLM